MMTPEKITIERYSYGEYIVEIEEKKVEKIGLMWDAWLTKKNYGVKEFMFGVIADQSQAKEPHVYTKQEALALIFANVDEYIDDFRAEYEAEDTMKQFDKNDLSLIMDGAAALERGLADASESGANIGNALNHAQAILAELSAAGILPSWWEEEK